MNFNEALDQTIKHYSINAKDLAELADISPQAISDYRRGRKDLTSQNLKKIINCLSNDQKKHFSKLADLPCGNFKSGDVWEQLQDMSAEELAQLVVAIGQRIPIISKSTDKQLQEV